MMYIPRLNIYEADTEPGNLGTLRFESDFRSISPNLRRQLRIGWRPVIVRITGSNLCTRAKFDNLEQLGIRRANDWPVMRVTLAQSGNCAPERAE
jgi:hypothetical protein